MVSGSIILPVSFRLASSNISRAIMQILKIKITTLNSLH
nr:MAG TPA: hypothetical protein [Caudoviricetes sp.]